jgi:hypothetical protein
MRPTHRGHTKKKELRPEREILKSAIENQIVFECLIAYSLSPKGEFPLRLLLPETSREQVHHWVKEKFQLQIQF